MTVVLDMLATVRTSRDYHVVTQTPLIVAVMMLAICILLITVCYGYLYCRLYHGLYRIVLRLH